MDGEPKTFKAHYGCTCSACGGRIVRGQDVHYHNGDIVCCKPCYWSKVQALINQRNDYVAKGHHLPGWH